MPMAMEPAFHTHGRSTPAFGISGTGQGVVVCPQAAGWLSSRVADDHGELTLQVEADEHCWRIRRTVGHTASMFEKGLALPVSASEVATALVRWASAAGLHAKHSFEPNGAVRVHIGKGRD